jgi:hypothetical protein
MMFIKWRTYQRQLNGVKGDKYIQQPILVESYRIGIKKMKEQSPNIPPEAYDHPVFMKKVLRPRHHIVFKFPSYPLCMVVYFRSPEFMKQRFLWWQKVDEIILKLSEALDGMTPQVVDKLKAELERVVPRVTPDEEKKLSVVLNDLPLH